MYYVDKILEVLIVTIINILLIFLGRAIYKVFFGTRKLSLQSLLVYFGIGSGSFGTIFFFYGATIGLTNIAVLFFLLSCLIISSVSLFRSRDEIWNLIRSYRIKQMTLLESFLILLLVIILVYNIYRGLWPDIDFDSTWYHLTESKIYLMNERISYIKGSLLYYSAMPQLIESFYLLGLFVKSGITAKLFHTFFGIWCVFLSYVWGKELSKSKLGGLISALFFYTSNIVIWESQNAYIDLGVTLYVSLGLWFFWKSLKINIDRTKLIFLSSIFIGFALGSKLLSIYWVIILVIVNVLWLIGSRRFVWKEFLLQSLIIGGIPLLIWLPWGLYSFIYTNNPVFPLLEGIFNENDWFASTQMEGMSINVWFVERIQKLINFPINIIYDSFEYNRVLIYLFFFSVLSFLREKKSRIVGLIFMLFLLLWSFTPASSGRFFLPITILLSVYSGYLTFKFIANFQVLSKLSVSIVAVYLTFAGVLGSWPNGMPSHWVYSKFTEEEYLKYNVSQNIWSFYDYNGEVEKLVNGSKVLVFNVHNLFYLNFDFEDISWVVHEFEHSNNKEPLEYIKTNFDYVFINIRTMEEDLDLYSFCDEAMIPQVQCTEDNFVLVYSDNFADVQIYEIIK